MAGINEVSAKLTKEFNITVSSAKEMITTILDTVTEMAGTETVRVGKHTFKTVKRAARVCRNPKTGEKVDVPAKEVLVYKHAKPKKEEAVAPSPETKKKSKKK
jgi:nucleoid DNA-binding protein